MQSTQDAQDKEDPIDTRLSALLDGELGEFETRALLRQMDELPQGARETLLGKWRRYQVVRETITGEKGAMTAAPGFAGAVASRLQDEVPAAEAGAVQQHRRAPMWSKIAVAASVAFAVVFGVQQFQPEPAGVNRVASTTAAPAAGNPALALSAAPASAPVDADIAQQRLQRYILQHANNAARQGGQGITPFARVASFESE